MDYKKLFFISAAIGICIWSLDKVYRLSKMRNDEKELQLQRDNEQRLQFQLIEKRALMDKFYLKELKNIMYTYVNSARKWLQDQQLNNSIARIENDMVHDGYKYAEIGELRNQALLEVKKSINLR